MKTKPNASESAAKTRRILAPSEADKPKVLPSRSHKPNTTAQPGVVAGTNPKDHKPVVSRDDDLQASLARVRLLAASNAKKARLRQAAIAAQKAKAAGAAAKARQLKAVRARQASAVNVEANTGADVSAGANAGVNAGNATHSASARQAQAIKQKTSNKNVQPSPAGKRKPQAQSRQRKAVEQVAVAQKQGAADARPAVSQALPEENKVPPIIKATALLAAKYPNIVEDTNDNRTKSETRIVFIVAFIIGSIIAAGWMNWDSINFQSEGDFVYNSGLVGGIMMAVILIYALRKRVKILRKAGNMEAWYYFHLLGGVLGPLIIVFHTSFSIKSINSAVALFTMITVVFSGLFGRYIYTRIGYNLHRKLLLIKSSEQALLEKLRDYHSPLSDKIERRLSNFALASLTGPRSLIRLPMRLLAIHTSAMGCYVKVGSDLTSMVKSQARREGWPNTVTKNRVAFEKDQLRKYINAIAEIANIHLLERVLVMWRILHIPLLYILVITSLAHVLAVHMY